MEVAELSWNSSISIISKSRLKLCPEHDIKLFEIKIRKNEVLEMNKYKLLKEQTIMVDGVKLYRIQALRDFGCVKAGDIGGYVQGFDNLCHQGDCWLYDNSMSYGEAEVYGDARVCENAIIKDSAEVFGDAVILNDVVISGYAMVYGDASVIDADVTDFAQVYGDASISTGTVVKDYAHVAGTAQANYSTIGGKTQIFEGTIWNATIANRKRQEAVG